MYDLPCNGRTSAFAVYCRTVAAVRFTSVSPSSVFSSNPNKRIPKNKPATLSESAILFIVTIEFSVFF